MSSSFLAQEIEAGRNVYHIAFAPRTRRNRRGRAKRLSMPQNSSPLGFLPRCRGASPFLVRTMWFDLPGIGFNVVYKRLEDGVWFPSSFGTEFRLNVGPLFFFDRDISISLKNSGFEHTHVDTK